MSDYNFKKISVGVINLKSHNLFSIVQALKNIGYSVTIIEDAYSYKKKDILILPGVGSFKYAINYLKKNGFSDLIMTHVQKNKLLFGICLGMQLLFSYSEEFGPTKGLNLIEGGVIKFDKKKLKVPNIGWENINKKKNSFLLKNIFNKKFYFTHSYYCKPKNKQDIISTTVCNNFEFCSSVSKEKILGTQFHPEKSGIPGLKILKNLKNII